MGWWGMSDRLQELIASHHINAHDAPYEVQLQWWNSLSEEDRELIVAYCAKVLEEIIVPLADVYRDIGVAIVDWYNNLDPEIKEVLKRIGKGDGVDALRK